MFTCTKTRFQNHCNTAWYLKKNKKNKTSNPPKKKQKKQTKNKQTHTKQMRTQNTRKLDPLIFVLRPHMTPRKAVVTVPLRESH